MEKAFFRRSGCKTNFEEIDLSIFNAFFEISGREE
jgi:hypothetical protein